MMAAKCSMVGLNYAPSRFNTPVGFRSTGRTCTLSSGLRGLALPIRRQGLHQKPRILRTYSIAAPMSTQFTKIPGFTQIGEAIPEGVSLSDVVKSLPEEVFKIDDVKAWKNVAVTIGAVALGYAALAVSPWYMYPIVYAYLGTAMTGLFVVGHDAGHNSFSKHFSHIGR